MSENRTQAYNLKYWWLVAISRSPIIWESTFEESLKNPGPSLVAGTIGPWYVEKLSVQFLCIGSGFSYLAIGSCTVFSAKLVFFHL